MKNIILIGMPGSGKSSVAKFLSQNCFCKYIDTDLEITKQAKKDISDIFKDHGENYFRKIEHQVIKNIPQNKNLIIAVGGGSVSYAKNLPIIKNLGIKIYLYSRPKKIYKKIITDKKNSRPLIKNYSSVKQLFSKRYTLYKSLCDYIIDCDKFSSLREISQKLICFIK